METQNYRGIKKYMKRKQRNKYNFIINPNVRYGRIIIIKSNSPEASSADR